MQLASVQPRQSVHDLPLGGVPVCVYMCVWWVCVWLWRRGQARIKQAWQARLAGSHVQLPEAVGMCCPRQSRPLE